MRLREVWKECVLVWQTLTCGIIEVCRTMGAWSVDGGYVASRCSGRRDGPWGKGSGEFSLSLGRCPGFVAKSPDLKIRGDLRPDKGYYTYCSVTISDISGEAGLRSKQAISLVVTSSYPSND